MFTSCTCIPKCQPLFWPYSQISVTLWLGWETSFRILPLEYFHHLLQFVIQDQFTTILKLSFFLIGAHFFADVLISCFWTCKIWPCQVRLSIILSRTALLLSFEIQKEYTVKYDKLLSMLSATLQSFKVGLIIVNVVNHLVWSLFKGPI